MSLKEEKEVIDTIRKCQRNWDLTKSIPEEHIDHWAYIATHAPSKQDESYYNLYIITNKEKIQLLLDHTWGHTLEIAPRVLKGITRNTQMAANAYFLFTLKLPLTVREIRENGKSYDQHGADINDRKRNGHIAIGIASGLIAQSAARLGYKTGFNTNHCQRYVELTNSKNVWKEELMIPDHEEIIVGIGIGWPQEGKKRNDHSETEFLTGELYDKKHSVNDQYCELDGIRYPTPKINYKTYSDIPKKIKVTKF
jgi:nitroreductase